MTGTRPRILYIDDDEGLRRLAARALTRRGYEVVLAASGAEGVEMARAGGFDLAAVDHYMPGQDGLATLAALPASLPVVYVTGSEESSVAVAALKAGAVDYVVKTVGDGFFDLLASAFQQALRQKTLLAEKESAEEALRTSNARLQALLREVNHRVSNSLQMVSAFVHMQSSLLTDEISREALRDTQRRIEAIALVHRSLYTSDNVDAIEMDDYLGALVKELEGTWSTPASPRKLTLTSEPLRLKTDQAVSVGVIVSELVSNACKYAYPPDRPGEVRISLGSEGRSFLLRVEDDGCGLGGEIKGTGLGTKLIAAMAASLRADLRYDPAHRGCAATLSAAF